MVKVTDAPPNPEPEPAFEEKQHNPLLDDNPIELEEESDDSEDIPAVKRVASVKAASEEGEARRASLMDEIRRNQKLIKAMVNKSPPWLKEIKPYADKVVPILAMIATFLDTVMPYCIRCGIFLAQKYEELPDEIEWGLFGVWLCFFGGVFPVLVLTVETFLMTGWDETQKAIMSIYKQFLVLESAFRQDDKKDEDGDGIKDVNQLSGDQLFMRKFDLFLDTANPKKIAHAAGVIFNAWLAVVAVLRVEFARTTALGVAIGDVIMKTIGRVIIPVAYSILPEKYHKWIPLLVKYFARSIGMSVAWTLQSVISAFHSAVRGGFMAARMGLQYHAKKNRKRFNDEESYLDELIGSGIAFVGFYIQLRSGFSLPFPLNIVLFPFTLVEWLIRFVLADDTMFNG